MKHTLSVLVENKPGALMRVTSMFARRGFNIESLAVGPTERHEVSRITLRVDCEHHTLEQIEKQMHKLVNVLRVQELTPGESVERPADPSHPGGEPPLVAVGPGANFLGRQLAYRGLTAGQVYPYQIDPGAAPGEAVLSCFGAGHPFAAALLDFFDFRPFPANL